MSRWRAKALELFPEMRIEIDQADSPGAFSVELAGRRRRHYDPSGRDQTKEPRNFIRSVCLYAAWSEAAKSGKTREAAGIGFYEQIIRDAFSFNSAARKALIEDLVAHLGISKVESMAKVFGSYVGLERANQFRKQAWEAEENRRRRSTKRI